MLTNGEKILSDC